jgi:hypothetical protein
MEAGIYKYQQSTHANINSLCHLDRYEELTPTEYINI